MDSSVLGVLRWFPRCLGVLRVGVLALSEVTQPAARNWLLESKICPAVLLVRGCSKNSETRGDPCADLPERQTWYLHMSQPMLQQLSMRHSIYWRKSAVKGQKEGPYAGAWCSTPRIFRFTSRQLFTPEELERQIRMFDSFPCETFSK